MEAQRQQVEEYEKQRQQQIEQAKKFKEEQEREKQEAQRKAFEEYGDERGEEESEDTEGGSEDTDEESEREEESGQKVNAMKEAEKKKNDQAKKDMQKATAESTKTPNLQPIKRQDDPLLGASPRAPGGKTSPAVSLPSIGAHLSPTKGNSLLGGGGLSPSVGDSLKGATVGRAGLLPLGKGKKNKGTWRKNKAFTSRSRGN